LRPATAENNWVQSFRDITDLKALVQRDLGKLSLRTRASAEIQNERTPFVDVKVVAEYKPIPVAHAQMHQRAHGGPIVLGQIFCFAKVVNISDKIIYRMTASASSANADANQASSPFLAIGHASTLALQIPVFNRDQMANVAIDLTYFSSSGVKITEQWSVGLSPDTVAITEWRIGLVGRKYEIGHPSPIEGLISYVS
jgi:hypothetical protein